MEPKRKKIRLREKETGRVKALGLVQYDSIQGHWCIDSNGDWKWYPHDKWEKVK
jgi:hypothetical protein